MINAIAYCLVAIVIWGVFFSPLFIKIHLDNKRHEAWIAEMDKKWEEREKRF